jgi:ribosomal protein L37AE/L43A
MAEQRRCDFCGRSERDLSTQAPAALPALARDEDGLWVCRQCRAKLVLPPVGEAVELPEALAPLVGQSAGAICRTLNLPYAPPYQSAIDAAARIAYDEDRYMSSWLFVTQWLDGTTVWQAEDGDARAVVAPDGSVRVLPR